MYTKKNWKLVEYLLNTNIPIVTFHQQTLLKLEARLKMAVQI